MSLTTAAAAVAGTAAAAAYLDAKLHISNDIKAIIIARHAEREWAKALKEKRQSCFNHFETRSRPFPDALAIWSRTGNYTWSQVYDRACQYAAFFLSQGVQLHQPVAIYMQNAPEFMFTWLGLMAIGSAPAMVNWNLSGESLVHCLKIAGAQLLLVHGDEGCLSRIENERERIEGQLQIRIVILSEALKIELAASAVVRPDDTYREDLKAEDPAALIYTSGTTGYPKLFPFTVNRLYIGGVTFPTAFGQRSGPLGDRWYNCMPLYHGTGGVIAMLCLMSGLSLAIGSRFSISQFWDEVRDSESTSMVYVGETARYLLAAPPSPLDKQHKMRLMYGNGLRPDVWTKFQNRFGVSEVAEFFTSTEGMFYLINHSKGPYKASAVGHHGFILRYLFRKGFVPVEIDHETGDIYRSPKTGFGRRKNYAEGGEIIILIPDKTAFPGYWRSPDATNKKFAQDVFKKGDVYYRTGDALRRTDDGRWFFLDRLGDTYRWKSENVSTAEVAEIVGNYPEVVEANAYGVLVPGHEGRAGCAAMTLEPGARRTFDWTALANYLKEQLPRYAVPVFVRVLSGEVGGLSSHNNKPNKVPLRAEGVDPALRGTRVDGGKDDEILWLPPKASTYLAFTEKDWNSLVVGEAKL